LICLLSAATPGANMLPWRKFGLQIYAKIGVLQTFEVQNRFFAY
jgi:hypothetical protein